MFLSHHKNAGQNHGIKIAKRSFKNVAQFKYLGATVTNQMLFKRMLGGDRILITILYPGDYLHHIVL
jgi:hypothetical protein